MRASSTLALTKLAFRASRMYRRRRHGRRGAAQRAGLGFPVAVVVIPAMALRPLAAMWTAAELTVVGVAALVALALVGGEVQRRRSATCGAAPSRSGRRPSVRPSLVTALVQLGERVAHLVGGGRPSGGSAA